MPLHSKDFGRTLVWIIRFVCNLFPPLRARLKRLSQEYAAQGERAQLEGRLEAAAGHFQEALVWQPDNASLHSSLGQIYYEESNSSEAEKQFRKALSYDYGNLEALKGLGLLIQEQGNSSEAMFLYLKYLNRQPKDAVVSHNLATIYHNNGDYETAISYYKRAELEDPNDPLLLKNLGLGLLELGKITEAEATFTRAGQSDPEDAEVDRLLASVLEAQGKYESALAASQSAVNKEPKNPDAHLQLAQIAISLDRFKKAAEHSELAEKLFMEAGDPLAAGQALWEVGWSHYMLGDWTRSVEASRQALKLNRDLIPVHFNIGLALLHLKRRDEARQEYLNGVNQLEQLSDLKEHGIDDLKDALDKEPELPGGREILNMLEEKYSVLSNDLAKSAQQATA